MNLADAIFWTGASLVFAALGVVISSIFRPSPESDHLSDGLYAVGYGLCFLSSVMDADPISAVVFGLIAAFHARRWWKNRRNGRGRRALRELGDKSRRRIQALVDQMTPSPIPSPAGA